MAEYGMPEIRKSNLFTDWYEMFVEDKKKQKGLSPSAPVIPPTAPISPISNVAAPSAPMMPAPPGTPAPPVAPQPSWSDKLNTGLQDPAKLGLLTAGLSILATPPRQVPYSTGEIIGRAGLAGVEAFQGAVKSAREGEKMRLDAAEHKGLEAYRAAQVTHLDALNKEIQARVRAGEETEKIYADSLSTGLDKTIEEKYALPTGTGKLVIKSAVKSGKGIHDMFKESTADPKDQEIPADIVPLLGFPEGAKIKWSQANAVSTLMPKKEKERIETPHTTILERDQKGETPGYQHTWAWDPKTSDYTKYVGPRGRTHAASGGGGKMEGQAKVGILGSVSREMTNRWFPKLQAAMPPGDESMQKIKEIQIQIGMGDQVSGAVNDARMRSEFSKYGLDIKEYQWVKTRAEDLAGEGKNPSAAINQAEAEWSAQHPKKGEAVVPKNLKPIIDPATGKQRTVNGRPAYQDPAKPGKVIVY